MNEDEVKAFEAIAEAAATLGWAIALVPGADSDDLEAIIIGKVTRLAELGDLIE